MVYIKDGKKYYTREEMEKRLDVYIEKSADEMILELRKRRKKDIKIEINNKEYAYV